MGAITSTRALIALIIVVVIVILAWFAIRWYRRRHTQERFGLGAPATRLVIDGLVALSGRLADLSATAQAFASTASQIETSCAGSMAASVTPRIAAARQAVAAAVAPLDATRVRIAVMPPTYANVAEVYYNLCNSDQALLKAARSFEAAGRGVHQNIAQQVYSAGGTMLSIGTKPGLIESACIADLSDAGNVLQKIGEKIQRLSAAVHNLGVTLDLE